MGQRHLNFLKEIKTVELCGVADPVEENRTKVAEQFDIKAFASMTELLSETRPDAVYITTPIRMHLENIREAFAAGCHIFCEKPLVPTVKEGRGIIKMYEGSDRVLFTGLAWRFSPTVKMLKQIISEGVIGRILQFRVVCGGPSAGKRPAWFEKREIAVRGCMLDTGVHFFDMITYTLGEKLSSASAFCDQTNDKVDLNAGILLQTENGGIGSMHFTSSMSMGGSMEYYGENGTIVFDPGTFQYTVKRPGVDDETVKVEESERFSNMAMAFIDAVNGKTDELISVEDALLATAAAEAGYLSFEKKIVENIGL